MGYQTITPFRRPVDAALLARAASAAKPLDTMGHSEPIRIDKWVILRDAAVARPELGLSDRNLVVLQALLSFIKGAELSPDDRNGLVVHPSNTTLSARLNGMPASTLRRHLACLVDAGLIARRDSPNGKRYVRRHRDGDRNVFGLDLSPLLHRASEIAALAETVRAQDDRRAHLRQTVSLMRRDLAGLVTYGRTSRPDIDQWDEFDNLAILTRRFLRRRQDDAGLELARDRLSRALDKLRLLLEPSETSTSDIQNERHCQTSHKDLSESEDSVETSTEGDTESDPIWTAALLKNKREVSGADIAGYPPIPLQIVLSACPEIGAYSSENPRHWHDLHATVERVRPMMGISVSAWNEAVKTMGLEIASTVVAAILQRFDEIRNPGGYLRALTSKAANGTFSCGPMIMSLLRATA